MVEAEHFENSADEGEGDGAGRRTVAVAIEGVRV